ncbi:hypothetical protein [Corynebacterium aurimucosum]|uniref:hypothetical protein n=1 Tax=Corynebacterium aurimucosum TaxID=169292 RepID=UPI00187A0EBF|nr:hypothetical protein [Corynebacterium aurimucosum]MBE7340214.1 hypothetical protein [Corynebacterium aurimucosum]
MRIESLSNYQPIETGFALLLSSSEKLQPLPLGQGSFFFCFSEEELMLINGTNAVLIDLPPRNAIRILSRLVRERGEAQYWAPRSDTARLCSLVGTNDSLSEGLAISGLNVSDAWIQLRVSRTHGKTRDAEDFLRGLSAPFYGGTLITQDYGQSLGTATLRTILISRAATLAKPVKKYLPSAVIVALYKILEKFR